MHQVSLSQMRWASRWTHLNNRASSQADQQAHQALLLKLLSQAKNRRRLSGKLGHVLAKQHMLTSRRMGELEPWIDENFVRSVWFGMGYQVNVKMIRDKFSG